VTADSYVSVEKAARVLGFDPRFSSREALLRNFQWYLDHQTQASQRFGVSHRTPWKQGALRLGRRSSDVLTFKRLDAQPSRHLDASGSDAARGRVGTNKNIHSIGLRLSLSAPPWSSPTSIA
jgi:hypothetical protein